MFVKRPKILLADDSISIRRVVELTFAEEGIDVIAVSDGEAAMQRFNEEMPDLVIADVHLPTVGGYQLCEIIKGDESTREIPVILVVGSFEPFDPGEASRVGASYYFVKPFRSVKEVVDKALDLMAAREFAEVMPPETADIENLYAESIVEDDTPIEEDMLQDGIAASPTIDEPIASDTVEEFRVAAVAEIPASSAFDLDEVDDMLIHEERFDRNEADAQPTIDPFETIAVEDPGDAVIEQAESATRLSIEIVDEEVPAPAIEQNGVTPELIDEIVGRVLERLSDKTVREVALDAVPRIAEKLIREALEAGSKN